MNRGIALTHILVLLVGVLVLIGGTLVMGSSFFGTNELYTREGAETEIPTIEEVPVVQHMDMPSSVRTVYMSQCAASSDSFREHLGELIKTTEINSIIIDIKDFSGTVSFPRGDEVEDLGGTGCVVRDMEDYIQELHDEGIYVIGRITVFQDPLYAKAHPELAVQSKSANRPWQDHKGLQFIDVGATPFWDYIVALARESHDIGFDELNFDYIRYPSDGPMSDARYDHSDYTKRAVELEKFFQYLSSRVRKADAGGHVPITSADLFGMTTTNFDDLTIGQVMERATPYFDIIAPMTYPSHYPNGFNGYGNPNENVYGVIKYSMDRAVERVESATTTIASLAYTPIESCTPGAVVEGQATESVCAPSGEYRKPARSRQVLRPWLQDFDYGGTYDATKVRAQIQAVYDSGIDSWMLWDPANRYTKAALEPAQ